MLQGFGNDHNDPIKSHDLISFLVVVQHSRLIQTVASVPATQPHICSEHSVVRLHSNQQNLSLQMCSLPGIIALHASHERLINDKNQLKNEFWNKPFKHKADAQSIMTEAITAVGEGNSDTHYASFLIRQKTR